MAAPSFGLCPYHGKVCNWMKIQAYMEREMDASMFVVGISDRQAKESGAVAPSVTSASPISTIDP